MRLKIDIFHLNIKWCNMHFNFYFISIFPLTSLNSLRKIKKIKKNVLEWFGKNVNPLTFSVFFKVSSKWPRNTVCLKKQMRGFLKKPILKLNFETRIIKDDCPGISLKIFKLSLKGHFHWDTLYYNSNALRTKMKMLPRAETTLTTTLTKALKISTR